MSAGKAQGHVDLGEHRGARAETQLCQCVPDVTPPSIRIGCGVLSQPGSSRKCVFLSRPCVTPGLSNNKSHGCPMPASYCWALGRLVSAFHGSSARDTLSFSREEVAWWASVTCPRPRKEWRT